MVSRRLKTAVLGLGGEGQAWLEALSCLGYFELEAVADKNTQLCEQVAAGYRCRAYDDYRQLIIQNKFDCLLVADSLYNCDEYVRMAVKKGFHILKLAPLARNFEEAVGFVRLAEEVNVKFVVANTIRVAESFVALRQFLQDGWKEQVFGVSAFCTFGGCEHPAWQSDPKLAGGGVLLYNCYQIIDQLLWNFSMPGQVYGVCTNTASDKQQRFYLTEETAVVTMKFTNDLFVNLITSKTIGPAEEFVRLYSRDKILTVDDKVFTVADNLGVVVDRNKYDDNKGGRMAKVLENFALSILLPEENKPYSRGRENLRNMAVIESAYLSARTGMPEEPAKVMQTAHLEPVDIWPEIK
jgi:predicted dehydrogenase